MNIETIVKDWMTKMKLNGKSNATFRLSLVGALKALTYLISYYWKKKKQLAEFKKARIETLKASKSSEVFFYKYRIIFPLVFQDFLLTPSCFCIRFSSMLLIPY
jgi:hypothetical protein